MNKIEKIINFLTAACIAVSLLAIAYSLFINLIVKNWRKEKMKHEMKNTLKALDDAKAIINDARIDIWNEDLEMAAMQHDVVIGGFNSLKEQLEYDAQSIFHAGRMRGIDDMEMRLDNAFSPAQEEDNIFSSPKEQLSMGECNLTQEVK